MKKNVLTKVVLLMVIAMLALALVACDGLFGGDTDDGGKNPGNNNGGGNTDDPGNEPEEPVDAVGKIVEVVKKAGTLIDTVTEINANKTVGLDLAVGGTIKAGADFNHSAALGLKVNAKSVGARADIAVKVDNEAYVGLGYGDGVLYLTQPLNLINSSSTSARKVKVDISALEDSVDHMTTEGMKALQYLASMDALKNLDFDALAEDLKGGEEGGGLLDFVKDLLIISESEDGNKTIIGLGEEEVGTLLGVLPQFVGAFKDIIGYFDTAMDTFGIELDGQIVTYDYIVKNYCPALAIEVGYANDTINQIAIKLSIEDLDFEFGLVIDLNTLKVVDGDNDAINLTFGGYETRDLEASIGLDLGVKGIDAVLDLVVNSSDALKVDGNQVAGAKLTVNGVEAAAATFNGKTVYANANEIFSVLNASADGYKTEYAYSLGSSIIEMLNTAITENVVFLPEVNPASAAAEEEVGIFQTIYDLVYGVIGMTGLVEEMPTPATGLDTFEAFDPAVTSLLVTTIGEYTYFLDAETEGLMDAVANIVAIFNENKDLLLDSVHADTIVGEGETILVAGAQLTNVVDEDSADLADFILKFINVKLDGEATSTVEDLIAFGVEIVDYLWSLVPDGTDPEGDGLDYTDLFNADFIEGIVGVDLTTLLNQLYVSAGTIQGKGLNGFIEVKTTKEGTSYAKLSGEIGFKTYRATERDNYYVVIPEDLTNVTSFTAATESSVSGFGSYYVTDLLFGVLQAILAYEAPVAA